MRAAARDRVCLAVAEPEGVVVGVAEGDVAIVTRDDRVAAAEPAEDVRAVSADEPVETRGPDREQLGSFPQTSRTSRRSAAAYNLDRELR